MTLFQLQPRYSFQLIAMIIEARIDGLVLDPTLILRSGIEPPFRLTSGCSPALDG